MAYLLEDETRIIRGTGGTVCRVQWFADPDPFKPWEGDGAVPLISTGGRRGLDTDPARGFDLLNPLPYLSDSKIAAGLPKLAEDFRPYGMWNPQSLYSDAKSFDQFVREEFCENYGFTLREGRREFLADILGSGEDSQTFLEFVAALWQLAGVPAKVKESRGYCQGDWAALLIVAHPEAVKAWGFEQKDGRPNWRRYRKNCPNDLDRAAETWGAWAWGGGVVGYKVQEIDAEDVPDLEDDENGPDGVTVDSCWGFYPDKGQDAFDLDDSHAYAIERATEAALDHVGTRDDEKATAWAAAMYAARPDLAPVELGGLA
jgi:hypothetical protein